SSWGIWLVSTTIPASSNILLPTGSIPSFAKTLISSCYQLIKKAVASLFFTIFKFFHRIYQSVDRRQCQCIVYGSPETSYRTVPFDAYQVALFGQIQKLRFVIRIIHYEGHIHT